VKLSQCILLAIALATLPVEWAAQAQQSRPPTYASIARDGYRLTKVEAEAFEAALASNPDDLATRTKLLGFYFRGAGRLYGPEATIAARRQHILWLIEHHPGSEVSQLSEATIDAAGHALADMNGYAEAARLWTKQAQQHGNDPRVLGNAARFFQLSDKQQAAALLKGAQRAAPQDAQRTANLAQPCGSEEFVRHAGAGRAGEVKRRERGRHRGKRLGSVRINDGRTVSREVCCRLCSPGRSAPPESARTRHRQRTVADGFGTVPQFATGSWTREMSRANATPFLLFSQDRLRAW